MLGVGKKFPDFKKKAVVSLEPGKEFETLTRSEVLNGKWTVFFWWPLDFTFVCPTEISSFNNHFDDFVKRDANLIGASIDSEFVHLAWRNADPNLKKLRFPMLADTSKSLAKDLGILEKENKIAYRATYIIDPNGVIQHVSVNGLNVGRNVAETLRLLDAFQNGGLVPCDWQPGDPTL
ncbi:MAG: peroxiredoxin [Draconibacterium sp.]|jgi:peroxiredoxin (alkyl hydroperoxide reductase subunit C)